MLSAAAAVPHCISTTRPHGLCYRPHYADEKTEAQRGEVTCPGQECVTKAGFRNPEAAGQRKHPNPSTPLATRTRGAWRPKIAFRAAQPPLSAPPRFALRPHCSGVPETLAPCLPAPSSRRPPGRVQPEPGREAGAAARRGKRLGEGAREAAARHSRVELVVHPLAVATASRSDFRSVGSLRLGPGHFRLRGEQRNAGAPARWGADIPGRPPRAAARRLGPGGSEDSPAQPRGLSPPQAGSGERRRRRGAWPRLPTPAPERAERSRALSPPGQFIPPWDWRFCAIAPASSGCRGDRTG